jgi:hypothetical protein
MKSRNTILHRLNRLEVPTYCRPQDDTLTVQKHPESDTIPNTPETRRSFTAVLFPTMGEAIEVTAPSDSIPPESFP